MFCWRSELFWHDILCSLEQIGLVKHTPLFTKRVLNYYTLLNEVEVLLKPLYKENFKHLTLFFLCLDDVKKNILSICLVIMIVKKSNRIHNIKVYRNNNTSFKRTTSLLSTTVVLCIFRISNNSTILCSCRGPMVYMLLNPFSGVFI